MRVCVRFSLSVSSQIYLPVQLWLCFEWFGATHFIIIHHFWFQSSLCRFSFDLFYILHYNLFALVSLSSEPVNCSPPHKFRMKKNATKKQLQKKNYDYVLQNCHHIKTNFYAIASEKRNIIKKLVLLCFVFVCFFRIGHCRGKYCFIFFLFFSLQCRFHSDSLVVWFMFACKI